MLLRGVKNLKERRAFEKLRKDLVAAGLKSDLPMTVKEYTRTYDGPKRYAREDYYFNWSKQMRDFYNRIGKKAERKIIKNDLEINPRTTFAPREGSHEGRATTMDLLRTHLRTIVNVNNTQYLNPSMGPRAREALVTSRDDQGQVLRAGKKSESGKPVTIQDFGGSLVRLAYNNYLVALSELGYTETLRTVLKMSPAEWEEIFKVNKERLEAVYVYSYMQGSGSDEAFNAIFTDNQDYVGDVMADDSGEYR